MSMSPQITQPTGLSTWTVLERHTDTYGVEKVRVKSSLGESTMEVGRGHDGCEFEGEFLQYAGAWANEVVCTGCNYGAYYPLGD